MTLRYSLCGFLVLAVTGACTPTQLVLAIESDYEPGTELNRLVVETFDESGDQIALTEIDVPLDAPAVRISLAVVPRNGDETRPVHVRVSGFAPGVERPPVVEASALTRFAPGEQRLLHVLLERSCASPIYCAVGQTCRAGECVSAERPLSSLPRTSSGEEFNEGPPFDAGPALDAGPPRPTGQGAPCGTDLECDADHLCEAAPKARVCAQRCSENADCSEFAACASGTGPDDRLCTTPCDVVTGLTAPTRPSDGPLPCPDGFGCGVITTSAARSAVNCVPAAGSMTGCATQDECAAGFVCVASQCHAICRSPTVAMPTGCAAGTCTGSLALGAPDAGTLGYCVP